MKIRRKKKPSLGESRQDAARESVAGFLSHKVKRTPIGGAAPTKKLPKIEVATLDAEHRSKTGVWDDAIGRTFVGLYALCHRIVYGEIPLELYEKAQFTTASRMATRALHEWFGDDPDTFVEFVKWSWEREKRRDVWAIRNGRDRGRMGVRFQFSAAMVQDWRIDKTKGHRGRR